jgi:thymidylate kinase
MDFHAKVSDAYLHIAEEHPERVVVIDGTQTPEKVHEAVMHALRNVLPERREHRERGDHRGHDRDRDEQGD